MYEIWDSSRCKQQSDGDYEHALRKWLLTNRYLLCREGKLKDIMLKFLKNKKVFITLILFIYS